MMIKVKYNLKLKLDFDEKQLKIDDINDRLDFEVRKMADNKTTKQETVGEALRDIAHHEHAFALADNFTNHIGDLAVYGTLYLLAILQPYVLRFEWIFVLQALVAVISLVRYQNFLRNKIACKKMTPFFVNTSLISTGVRAFVVVNAPLFAYSLYTKGQFNVFISIIAGLVVAIIGMSWQYHYLINRQVIDRQEQSPKQTFKNATKFIINSCRKNYISRGYLFDIVCAFVVCSNNIAYKEFILVKFEAWQFVLITILVLLGTIIFQKFLQNKVAAKDISKSFKWGSLIMTAIRGYLIIAAPWIATCLFTSSAINWLTVNLVGLFLALVATGLQYRYLEKVGVF